MDLVREVEFMLDSRAGLHLICIQVVSSIAKHNGDLSDRRRPFTQAEKLRSDVYFNYVRRIPSRALCDHLLAHYFAGPNSLSFRS